MDLRKVARLSRVLIASQMRSGRAASDPGSFFGRPAAITVADAAAFLVFFVGSYFGSRFVEVASPGFLGSVLPGFLPFVPLLGVAAVLVGGLMFEFAASARFASSDAVNWLPVTSEEYVVASSTALAALYSFSIALLAGIALGIGAAAGELPVALFAVALGVAGLFEGALLIEVLRALTQRAGTLGKRRGSAALVVRAAGFLVVFLVFELFFNPVILFAAAKTLSDIGPVGLAIPFLWGSEAVTAALNGNVLVAGFTVAGQALLLTVTAYAAARSRARYWVPSGGEIVFEAHSYGSRHSALGSLGLTGPESALVAKDLRGLVRRRELLPVLLLPFVIGIVLLAEDGGARGGSDAFLTLWLIAWVSGLSGLILAASSFGQERRGLIHLYMLPVPPLSVLRAKAVGALLVSLPIGLALATAGIVLSRPPLQSLPGALLTLSLGVGEGTAVGLLFATRFSDFQDRPRPQFVRPIPMLGATAIQFLLGGVTVAAGLALTLGGPAFLLAPGFLVAVVVGAGGSVLGILYLTVVSGRRLLREFPS
jgi:predicted permease